MIECAADLHLDRVYDFFPLTFKLLDPVSRLPLFLEKEKVTYD